MTNNERQLLVDTAKFTHQLSKDRDDMLVGITAALLDLYRNEIRSERDTKSDIIARLELQRAELSGVAGQPGDLFLKFLADNLAAEKLDAAKLYADPAAGSA